MATALQIWSVTYSKAFDGLPASIRESVLRKVDDMGTRLPLFPHQRLTGGSYDATLDLTDTATYTSGFLTLNGGTAAGAEAGLIAAILTGKVYLNVHSNFSTTGEIRGFLTVPEPGTWALIAALGLVGFGTVRRFRRG